MRNKTLAIFSVALLGVSVALGAVTGVFSSIKIGTRTVIPASTPGFTGTAVTGYVVLSDSPALLGVPTAPTAASGTNTTQLATTAFVQSAISGNTIARLNFTSCTVDDDGNAGQGCEATQSWGTTLPATYYIFCQLGTWSGGASIGNRGGFAINIASQTTTTFSYNIDSREDAGRTTAALNVTCWATN